MKAQELRSKKPEELQRLLQEKRVELCKARFDIKSNQIKDNQQQSRLKKDIARILTIMAQLQKKSATSESK
ncbi:MAG: 50S ribosomal protein L29 [Candidatus Moranbacteria bacterium]|nr:50S ribosomal protein L29 [Candidatus Moranbacteria bacterium]